MLFESESGPPHNGDNICSNCGGRVEPFYRFCRQCGATINGDAAAAVPVAPYPVRLTASHPGSVSRLSTFFRIILAIPLLIIVGIFGGLGGLLPFPLGLFAFSGLLGVMAFIHWLTILIRGRPVGWVFRTIAAVQRFTLRSYAYLFLMADRYPPFEGDWQLNYEVDEPQRIQRRQLVIWKTIVSIPHFFVLTLASFVVGVFVFIGWFAILLTGEFPKGLHDVVAGWLRWSARVFAYWLSMTDIFPGYSISEDGGRGGAVAYTISAITGGLIFFGTIGGVSALIAAPAETVEIRASYEDLKDGRESSRGQQAGVVVALSEVDDPSDLGDLLLPERPENRFVLFHVELHNRNTAEVGVWEGNFRLKDSKGEDHDPVIVTIDGVLSPVIMEGAKDISIDVVDAHVVFELSPNVRPSDFTYSPSNSFLDKQRVKFIFTD